MKGFNIILVDDDPVFAEAFMRGVLPEAPGCVVRVAETPDGVACGVQRAMSY